MTPWYRINSRTLAAGLALLLILGAGAHVACKGGAQKRPRPNPGQRVFTVHVEPVVERSISADIQVSGVSRPTREVSLTTQVQGTVTLLKVALGQRVEKGELLARVSTVGLWGDSRQASAEIARLKAELQQAEDERRDTERLFEQKIASRRELDESRYKVLRLQAQDAQARAKLAQVGERYQGGAVIAPFAGVIAEQGVELGDYISPGKVIGRLVDLPSVKVTMGLPEVDMVRVSVETPVSLTFPALGDRAFGGKILAVAPTADRLSGAFPVEIDVPNPTGELRGGMAARVQLHFPGIQGIFVPVEAVVRRSGQPVAYVLTADRKHVEQRPCTLGITRDGLTQVLTGLAAGELLVVSGNTRLRGGSRVALATGRAEREAEQSEAPRSGSPPRQPPARQR